VHPKIVTLETSSNRKPIWVLLFFCCSRGDENRLFPESDTRTRTEAVSGTLPVAKAPRETAAANIPIRTSLQVTRTGLSVTPHTAALGYEGNRTTVYLYRQLQQQGSFIINKYEKIIIFF
jgi:hypothetical protein